MPTIGYVNRVRGDARTTQRSIAFCVPNEVCRIVGKMVAGPRNKEPHFVPRALVLSPIAPTISVRQQTFTCSIYEGNEGLAFRLEPHRGFVVRLDSFLFRHCTVVAGEESFKKWRRGSGEAPLASKPPLTTTLPLAVSPNPIPSLSPLAVATPSCCSRSLIWASCSSRANLSSLYRQLLASLQASCRIIILLRHPFAPISVLRKHLTARSFLASPWAIAFKTEQKSGVQTRPRKPFAKGTAWVPTSGEGSTPGYYSWPGSFELSKTYFVRFQCDNS